MGIEQQPTLTTDRLILRPYRDTDFADVHAYAALPEVSRFMDWGPNTVQDTQDFLDRCVGSAHSPESSGHFYAVVLNSGGEGSGRMIGGCDLGAAHRTDRSADLGYCLHPDFWGRGYMTEAASALLGFAFGPLGLHRVAATCDPDNVGSWRVMEKVGMRREGHEREAVRFKGRWHDRLRYAMLGREWLGRG